MIRYKDKYPRFDLERKITWKIKKQKHVKKKLLIFIVLNCKLKFTHTFFYLESFFYLVGV